MIFIIFKTINIKLFYKYKKNDNIITYPLHIFTIILKKKIKLNVCTFKILIKSKLCR